MEIKPNARHGIVYRAENTFFRYQGWPSVTRDENGILYAASSAFRMQHVDPSGKTAMFVSRNEGETWTKPIVVNDSYYDDRDAGIISLGDGKLLLSWFSLGPKFYTDLKEHAKFDWMPKGQAAIIPVWWIAGSMFRKRKERRKAPLYACPATAASPGPTRFRRPSTVRTGLRN